MTRDRQKHLYYRVFDTIVCIIVTFSWKWNLYLRHFLTNQIYSAELSLRKKFCHSKFRVTGKILSISILLELRSKILLTDYEEKKKILVNKRVGQSNSMMPQLFEFFTFFNGGIQANLFCKISAFYFQIMMDIHFQFICFTESIHLNIYNLLLNFKLRV